MHWEDYILYSILPFHIMEFLFLFIFFKQKSAFQIPHICNVPGSGLPSN